MKALKPIFERKDKRGVFTEIVNGVKLQNISYGKMKKGAVMGNHYHKKTKVFFFLTSGGARVNILNVKTKTKETVKLSKGDGLELPPWHSHAIRFLKDSSFIMGKSIKYSPSSPDTYPLEVIDASRVQ